MATAAQFHYPFPQTGNSTTFLGLKTIKKTRVFPLQARKTCDQGSLRHKQYRPLRVVNEKVVGIDLGTGGDGGWPAYYHHQRRRAATPSVVAFTKTGDRLVGQIAKKQAVVNPENTFFSVKRFIGRKMNEVDEEWKQVSYKVVKDENGNVKLECPATGKFLLLRRFLLRS